MSTVSLEEWTVNSLRRTRVEPIGEDLVSDGEVTASKVEVELKDLHTLVCGINPRGT
jgi:hypothetical protein